MTDKEMLVKRARTLINELNKTLAKVADEGVTVEYGGWCVKPKSNKGVEGTRLEFTFSEITRVDL